MAYATQCCRRRRPWYSNSLGFFAGQEPLKPCLSLGHSSIKYISALCAWVAYTANEISQITSHIISRLLAVFLEESAHDAVFSFKDFSYIASRYAF